MSPRIGWLRPVARPNTLGNNARTCGTPPLTDRISRCQATLTVGLVTRVWHLTNAVHQFATEAIMTYEIIVEGLVLDVEVTHCENAPPQPSNRDSDWDCMGTRELEYKVLSGFTYDENGKRETVYTCCLDEAAKDLDTAIRVALWHEIDSRMRRSRWAA